MIVNQSVYQQLIQDNDDMIALGKYERCSVCGRMKRAGVCVWCEAEKEKQAKRAKAEAEPVESRNFGGSLLH